MKKYISVLALDVKNTIWKVLGLLALMSAVQLGYFYLFLQKEVERWKEAEMPWGKRGTVTSFDSMITNSRISIFFIISAVLIWVVLIWGCSEHGKVRSKFTWHRLQIERRQVFVVWVVHRAFWMAVMLVWQICLLVIMDGMYQEIWALGDAPQSLFLACYRNSFVHALIPLSDSFYMVRLVCCVLLWGMGTAYVGYMGFAAHRDGCTIVLAGMFYTLILFIIPLDLFRFKALYMTLVFSWVIGIVVSVKGSLGKHYDGQNSR